MVLCGFESYLLALIFSAMALKLMNESGFEPVTFCQLGFLCKQLVSFAPFAREKECFVCG